MLKSYLKKDNVAFPPPRNFILFELDFKVILLRLLHFLSDLKSTFILQLIKSELITTLQNSNKNYD